MPVYVDAPFVAGVRVGRLGPDTEWCHMIADTEEELHAMAASIGMKRSWFQDKPGKIPHYDLVPSKRAMALKRGAIEIGRRQFIEIGNRVRRPRTA
ncbi:MAG: DUF4031 domain-containing protein [Fimbriimonas sp.]